MIRTRIMGNGINLHFRQGCGLAPRGQARAEEGFCEFAGNCQIYSTAVEIILSRKGNVRPALNQVYGICKTKARERQECYLERQGVKV